MLLIKLTPYIKKREKNNRKLEKNNKNVGHPLFIKKEKKIAIKHSYLIY